MWCKAYGSQHTLTNAYDVTECKGGEYVKGLRGTGSWYLMKAFCIDVSPSQRRNAARVIEP